MYPRSGRPHFSQYELTDGSHDPREPSDAAVCIEQSPFEPVQTFRDQHSLFDGRPVARGAFEGDVRVIQQVSGSAEPVE